MSRRRYVQWISRTRNVMTWMLLLLWCCVWSLVLSDERHEGSISENRGTSLAAGFVTSRSASDHVFASYRIEFPHRHCCPVLYYTIGYVSADDVLREDQQCFDDEKITWSYTDREIKHLHANLTTDDFRCERCRTKIVCEGRFSMLYGYDAVANFSIGYPCGARQQNLSLEYDITLRNTIPVSCVPISAGDAQPYPDPKCRDYQTKYAKLTQRRFDVLDSPPLCPPEHTDFPFAPSGGDSGILRPAPPNPPAVGPGGAIGPDGPFSSRGSQEVTISLEDDGSDDFFDSDESDYPGSKTSGLVPPNAHCYQHLHEFYCLVFAPRCTDDDVMLPACRQMCIDYNQACVNDKIGCSNFPDSLNDTVCIYKPVTCPVPDIKHGWVTYNRNITESPTVGTAARFKCDELYERIGKRDAMCMFNGAWSKSPPKCVPLPRCNVTVLNNGRTTYDNDVIEHQVVAGTRVTFQCDRDYTLKGAHFATCLRSREWSQQLVQCISDKKSLQLELYLIPSISALILLVGVAIIFLLFRRRKQLSVEEKLAKRLRNFQYFQTQLSVASSSIDKSSDTSRTTSLAADKEFDMFLIYSSDDYYTVRDKIALPFEEASSYTLCIADRDFFAGRLIVENIQNALNQSRGVILALSQNFIESEWCKYEFFHAYHKAIEEPDFHLIIVLLQAFDSLKNVPKLFQEYYKCYTCIALDEKNFKDKLISVIRLQLSCPLSELRLKQGFDVKKDASELQFTEDGTSSKTKNEPNTLSKFSGIQLNDDCFKEKLECMVSSL